MRLGHHLRGAHRLDRLPARDELPRALPPARRSRKQALPAFGGAAVARLAAPRVDQAAGRRAPAQPACAALALPKVRRQHILEPLHQARSSAGAALPIAVVQPAAVPRRQHAVAEDCHTSHARVRPHGRRIVAAAAVSVPAPEARDRSSKVGD
eukprot:690590-Prymnesium_polylepis.1